MEIQTNHHYSVNTRNQRILIVEDEPIISLDISSILKQLGYTIVGEVSTGEEAVRKASESSPDLILMDIVLHGKMDGIEAARKIRASSDIPIIYITANADETTIDLARDTGPYAYLNKPVNSRDLTSNVDSALERHGMEKLLRERERMLSTLMGNLLGIAYRCENDREYTMEFISDHCYELTGYPAQDLIGNRILSYNDLILEEYREKVWQTIQDCVQKNEAFRMEYRIRTADGRIKWVWEQGCGVFSPEGGLQALEGFITDITERKNTDDALRRSEKEYRDLFDYAAIGIFRSTASGRFLRVNAAMAKMLGYDSPAEVLDSVQDIASQVYLDADKRNEVMRFIRESGDQVVFENTFRRKDGTTWTSLMHIRTVFDEAGAPAYFEGFVQDITERKKTEEIIRRQNEELESTNEELHAAVEELETTNEEFEVLNDELTRTNRELMDSEHKFRTLFESANDAILIIEALVITQCNRKALSIFKCGQADLMGKSLIDLSPPEQPEGFTSRELCIDRIDAAIGGTPQFFQWVHRRPDGSPFHAEISLNLMENRGKNTIQAIIRDVSERRAYEETLLLNESRLQALLDLSRMADAPLRDIVDFVLEQAVSLTRSRLGYIAFVSADEKVLTMYSWSKSAMEECRVRDKPIDYPLETTGLWGEAVRQRKPIITNDYSAPNPNKKGCPEGHVHLNRHMNIPVFDGEKIVIVAGVGNKTDPYDGSDVRQLTLLMDGLWNLIHRKYAEDEKHRLEEQVRHSQRMESLGRLAGGVAHDFNNMLTLISGNISMALMNIKPGNMTHDALAAAQRAADSATLLTQRLLAFSRRQVVEPAIVGINELLADLHPMLTRIAGIDIRLAVKPLEGLWHVKIDQGQAEQIIINLVMNARDAMREGGDLVIETSNEMISEKDCQGHVDFKPGPHVLLSVRDTGCGMSPEIKRHLFEPFFTTKPSGKGTGLGLATVYGSVKQNGGFIEVISETGQGSAFNIYFPAVTETVT